MTVLNPNGQQRNKMLKPVLSRESLSPYNDPLKTYTYYMERGKFPATVGYPHFSLPTCWFSPNRQDSVVIPNGKIISGIIQECAGSTFDEDNPVYSVPGYTATGELGSNALPYMGESVVPHAPSGERPQERIATTQNIGEDSVLYPGTSSYDWDTYVINDSSFDIPGLSKEIFTLYTMANGGVDTVFTYDSRDTTADVKFYTGVRGEGSFKVAASGEKLTVGSNKPIGITWQDLWQYRLNNHLGDGSMDTMSYYTEGFWKYPFINFAALDFTGTTDRLNTIYGAEDITLTGFGTGYGFVSNDGTSIDLSTVAPALYKLSKMWAFSYGTKDDCAAGRLSAGSLVYPDAHGNITFSNELDDEGNPTAKSYGQAIGKLYAIDNKFPKQLMDKIDTYPGLHGTGTDTAGMPGMLFDFVMDFMFLTGLFSTYGVRRDLLAKLVKQGVFGYAYVNLRLV